jgi:transposase
MNIIGIDVSKDILVGARINRSGKQVESYQIGNTITEIEQLITNLKGRHRKVVVACESTGDYHRDLALACLKEAIPFRLINPITTKQFVKVTVRGRKTDMSDALIVAKPALQGEGRYVGEADFLFTKSVIRTAEKLSTIERMVRMMLRRIEKLQPDEQAGLVLSSCWKSLQTGVKQLRKYAHQKVDKSLRKLLTSIPGIGPVASDIIISEIGDIGRFSSGKSLVAFAGIDPKVKQSGVSLKRNTKITKRGSPHLRYAIYLATMSAQQCNPEFKAHFDKKRSEGKTYKEATLSGSRKMAYRIYAVWKRGTPYVR